MRSVLSACMSCSSRGLRLRSRDPSGPRTSLPRSGVQVQLRVVVIIPALDLVEHVERDQNHRYQLLQNHVVFEQILLVVERDHSLRYLLQQIDLGGEQTLLRYNRYLPLHGVVFVKAGGRVLGLALDPLALQVLRLLLPPPLVAARPNPSPEVG